jgi:TonB dependent receptor/CarboxypepD_reg-like domain/TonB-dependent Receptor Plug Domain
MLKNLGLFLLLSVVGTNAVLAQESLLDKEITLDRSGTVEEILSEISKKGGFTFSYGNLVALTKQVEIQHKQQSIRLYLNELFSGEEVEYIVGKGKVIISFKGHKEKDVKDFTISGYIKAAATGEMLIGASISIKDTSIGKTYGNTSNQYGYYSLSVPAGNYVQTYSYMGYRSDLKEVSLFENLKLNVELSEDVQELQEVVVSDEETLREVSEIKMGVTALSIKTVKSMPAFLGEADVIKSITLLPGVATVGEGTTGFNVRGGAIDQNLVILDEAPVYNTSHLFGFFSVFNPDVVKDVEFYKSGIPARYGGRLSSVLDVTQKEGNARKLTTTGGLGLLGGRLAIEGPLIKDRSSFIIAGRRSYIGELLRGIDDFKNNHVGFYDLNAKVNFKINDRDRIYWSGYSGRDYFTLADENIKLSYRNLSTTLRWNHLFSDKLFSNFSAIYSNYKYTQGSTEKDYEFEGTTGIVTYNLKSDVTYYLNSKHTFNYGLNVLLYQFKGLKIGPASDVSPVATINVRDEYALEPSIYIQDDYSLNAHLKFSFGLRYSHYYNIGAGSVYVYQNNLPRDISNIIDTIKYSSGKVIKQYGGLEPRFSTRLTLNRNSALQLSYDRSRQYIHLISNTTSAMPLDIWKSSDTYIKPEVGDQFSIGYFRNVIDNAIEASVEIYYKRTNNIVDYKDGANLVINKAIDADLLTGMGRAYGIEFTFKKAVGRLTGWMSYTYSRTERQVNGKFLSEKINGGKYYPANYDFPNRVTMFVAFKASTRVSLAANFTYNTGRPTTYPDARYYYAGFVVPQYSARNQDRLPDYHRLDLSVTIEGKTYKKFHGQWVLSIYNVYGRKNAYSIYLKPIRFTRDTESIRLSILGSVLPSLTYNFKF